MRVCQSEHQASCFVVNLQIPSDFEAVQEFETDSQRQKNQQAPPPEPNMFPSQPISGANGARISSCGSGRSRRTTWHGGNGGFT